MGALEEEYGGLYTIGNQCGMPGSSRRSVDLDWSKVAGHRVGCISRVGTVDLKKTRRRAEDGRTSAAFWSKDGKRQSATEPGPTKLKFESRQITHPEC